MNLLFISIIFISIFGTLFHFTYKIFNKSVLASIFSSVNESVWEHIKILLSASFLWSLVDIFIYGNYYGYYFAKFISFISIIILIPVFYYLALFIFKKNIAFINITIFYVVVSISQTIFFNILQYNMNNKIFIIGLLVIYSMYLLFTIYPPKIFLFKDPVDNIYGKKRFTLK